MRPRIRFAGGRQLLNLLVVLVCFWLVARVLLPWLERENAARNDELQALTQAEATRERARFEIAFSDPDMGSRLAFCQDAIIERLPGHWRPLEALAMDEAAVEAYFRLSLRIDSLHRISCRAEGIDEARVAHPLAEQLLALSAAKLEASPTPAEARDAEGAPDLWLLARQIAAAAEKGSAPAAVELLLARDRGTILRRIGGSNASQSGSEATEFPTLFSSLAAPLGLPQRTRTRWSANTAAAFALLARELPANAAVVGTRIDDDEVTVAVRGPVAGLEAPYGSVAFDAWGELTTWLYPYDEPPGFGCALGISVETLRQRFDQACARLPHCGPSVRFSIADFSCSRDRDQGDWTLHIQSG